MIQNNPVIYFFIVLVVIFILLIIYFFIRYGINQAQGKIIEVQDSSQVCTYNSLPDINTMPKDKEGNYYYHQEGNNNYYILDRNSVFYLNVCKSLCGGATEKNGQCGTNNPLGFQECLNDLQPDQDCKNSAVPLAVDSNNNYYYAQSVSLQQPL